MTFAEFRQQVRADRKAGIMTRWREGQHAFNVLLEVNPPLAEGIRGGPVDPFYNDDRLPGFWSVVEAAWEAPAILEGSDATAQTSPTTATVTWSASDARDLASFVELPDGSEPRKPVTLEMSWIDAEGRRNTRFVAEFFEQAGRPGEDLRLARMAAEALNGRPSVRPVFHPKPADRDAGALEILRTTQDPREMDAHRALVALLALTKLRPIEEWHEDMGAVLWWRLPVQEPPWVGTPNDGDWPYEDQGEAPPTHFTLLPSQLLWPNPQEPRP